MTRAARCLALFDRVVDPPAVARLFECWTAQPPNAYLAAIEACEETDETAPVTVAASVHGPIIGIRDAAAALGVDPATVFRRLEKIPAPGRRGRAWSWPSLAALRAWHAADPVVLPAPVAETPRVRPRRAPPAAPSGDLDARRRAALGLSAKTKDQS